MPQSFESDLAEQQQWESQCLAAMLTCGRAIDSDEAKMLIHAAWSIERFRRLPPAEAAERLLENPAVRLAR
jgi:hypothetical protein